MATFLQYTTGNNSFTYQVLRDTTEKAVIKLTGKFTDQVAESNAVRIQANTLYGALNANTTPDLLTNGGTALPYYGLTIHKLWYDCVNPTSGDVELFWNASTPQTIAILSGTYEYDAATGWITFGPGNTAAPGLTGDIGIHTRGMSANTSYTIILELRKDNAYYQRGQFNEPAAFNYPPYGVRP